MKPKLFYLIVLVCLLILQSHSQDKLDIKFGKISASDFAKKSYSIDEEAGAIVLFDKGTSRIESTNDGGFKLEFKQHRRVHVLKTSGYEAANVSVELYRSGNTEETLDKVRAVTYNLENGKIVESKLDTKSGIFKDNIDKNWVVRKFTLPNIKEGSIFEYEYTISSEFIANFQPWRFQGVYPVLWSEYEAYIPQFFDYVFLSSGYKTYHIRKTESWQQTYQVNMATMAQRSQFLPLPTTLYYHRWVMKDVPMLKLEPYTTSLENHIAKIEFQLSAIRFPNTTPIDRMGNWNKLADALLKDEDLGVPLGRNNNWLDDEMRLIVGDSKGDLEKARKIYAYLRDNYTCTHTRGLFLTTNLRNTLKNKKGNVADINLMLICMLRHQGISADPVIVGTRDNRATHSIYPILTQYNKVICLATIEGVTYYLDASRPRLGFGYLPLNCYNGHSRRIAPVSTAVYLLPDSVKERKVTSVIMINNKERNGWDGAFSSLLGYYESLELRDEIKEKGMDEYANTIRKNYSPEFDLKSPQIDSLDLLDKPAQLKYEFSLGHEKENIIYFTPMLSEAFKENPFKSAKRFYPVEMSNTIDETYILTLEIPEGYVVDELPKSMVLKLNDQEDGLYEYRISSSGGNVSLRSRLRIKRTLFAPEEYDLLREFFNMIVGKQAEQIVLKKKM